MTIFSEVEKTHVLWLGRRYITVWRLPDSSDFFSSYRLHVHVKYFHCFDGQWWTLGEFSQLYKAGRKYDPLPRKYELPPNPSRADIRVASFVGVHYNCKKSAIPKKFNASTPPYLLAPCLIYYMHDLQWTVKLLWQVHIPTNSHCKSEDIIIRSVEVNRNAYMRSNTLPAKIRILDLGDSK
mgnify:CR=1 FL=1